VRVSVDLVYDSFIYTPIASGRLTITKTVVTCKIKHLQNICKNVLDTTIYLQAVFDPAKMFCNVFANVFSVKRRIMEAHQGCQNTEKNSEISKNAEFQFSQTSDCKVPILSYLAVTASDKRQLVTPSRKKLADPTRHRWS